MTNQRWTSRWTAGLSICGATAALLAGTTFAQSADDEVFVVVKAGKVITVSGEEIDNGEIVIVDGKIELVGRDLEYPPDAHVIEALDQVVTPGMIHTHARMNLPRYNRRGVNAHYDVADEVYLNELDFDDLLAAGYTAVCLHPEGSGIPGMSRVYRTAGPDATRVLSKTPYLRVTMDNPGSDKPTLRGAFAKAKSEIEKVEKARKEWEEKQKKAVEEQKKAEEQKKKEGGGTTQQDDGGQPKEQPAESKPEEFEPPAIDPSHQRIVDLIQKKAAYPLLLEVGGASDVLHALDVMQEEKDIEFRWLLNVGFRADFDRAVETLAEQKKLILVFPGITSVPSTSTRYNLCGEFAAAGCELAFVPTGESAGQLTRMRTNLAELHRSGSTRPDLIRSISINQAKAVGLEGRLGAIEKGKDADLIFLDGDPLNALTEVKRVMILGELVWEDSE